MNAGRRHALVLAAGMGAVAGLTAWLRWRPDTDAAGLAVELDRVFPDRIGDWQVDREAAAFVRAADRRGRQTGLFDQVLERTFIDPSGRRVMLSVAYLGSQSSDMQLHRPEVCYRAGGFRVGGLHAARLEIGGRMLPVTRLMAEMPGRPEPITYWTIVDGEVGSATQPSWWERLKRAARRRETNGVLVRISSIDRVADRAFKLHGEFAAELARGMSGTGRQLVLGARRPG
ncbi:exosortase C-terminal domain/associated protein EpsI [uncultured Piscinibacter sp.]|uniref:exosortase C-terminal domain/associated protein EpsI n=1 Tax=uncultured Piscinibacter sp. TaxID=1131835 RepID=UPI00262E0517|nr:exosortase C-terminal domain/associated protein EpsI [uncultured Piscinibacter sp.]